MKNLLLLSIVLFTSNTFSQDIWVKPIGEVIAIGAKNMQGKVLFENEKLESFCNQAETYLSGYLEDYTKYSCDRNSDFSRNLCKLIRKELERFSFGPNDFSTNQPRTNYFTFKNENNIDWEVVKREIAEGNDVKISQVHVVGNKLSEDSLAKWVARKRKAGFFLNALMVNNKSLEVLDDPRNHFEGEIQNRYMACALSRNEVTLSKVISSNQSIVESYPKENLTSLFNSYREVQDSWEEHFPESVSSVPYALLYLGQTFKENRRFFTLEQKAISGLEFQFDTFFSYEVVRGKLKLDLKFFSSIDELESKSFPPKTHKIQYQTMLSTGSEE